MKVAIWIPRYYETSVKVYVDNIRKYLEQSGVVFVEVNEHSTIPDDVDLVWDPNCTGAKYPNRRILFSDKKWIITLHGASNFSLPLHYTFTTTKQKIVGLYKNLKRRIAWFMYKYKATHIITVSTFAKSEIIEQLHIDPKKISIIYHGYNDDIFRQYSGVKKYFFNVSIYQKVKNIDRLIEAYNQLPIETRMPLIIVCPNYPNVDLKIEKLTLITHKISQKEVAKYMEDAYCFVFPSIRESFGLPLIEAFACGVPVIASNTSALKELTKDAGILIDPFSVEEIKNAMLSMMENKELRDAFAAKAVERAKDFSWQKSAQLHLEIFKRTLD